MAPLLSIPFLIYSAFYSFESFFQDALRCRSTWSI
uniref:Uncharacterized protein n=1 Tax=Siphoviridae sp. ct2vX3 TaxID=2825318 RepID=A0A8S5PYV4_9CAUD|nr:MAG TPA: hypothetical protein [Siphoviridae sp. ct2vX3]